MTDALLDRLEPGMLVLADRGFFSYALWRKAIGTGADLLWRIRTDPAGPKPPHLRDLEDGSWLAHLRRATPAAARRQEPILVRVIDYSIEDGRENTTGYRLFTTLLDPDTPPRPSWPRPTPSAGRSSWPLTSSRPTSADPAACCARSPPTWSSKRSGATCAATTRSAP